MADLADTQARKAAVLPEPVKARAQQLIVDFVLPWDTQSRNGI